MTRDLHTNEEPRHIVIIILSANDDLKYALA